MWNSRWSDLKTFMQLLNWWSCDSHQDPLESKESILSTLWGLWGNNTSTLDLTYSFSKEVRFFRFLNSCQTSWPPPQMCLYWMNSFWTYSRRGSSATARHSGQGVFMLPSEHAVLGPTSPSVPGCLICPRTPRDIGPSPPAHTLQVKITEGADDCYQQLVQLLRWGWRPGRQK